MDEARESFTLSHSLPWDLRLAGIAIGAVFAAFPWLSARYGDGALAPVLAAACVLGGLGFMALFFFLNASHLTADGETLTLRHSGVFGGRRETLPLGDVEQAEVMQISTRSQTSYCVAVKLRGRRRSYMGESYAHRRDAETALAAFRKAAGLASNLNPN